MDLARFRSDVTAETEGKWFPVAGKARVKVARSNSPRYKAALRRRLEAHKAALRVDDEAANDLATRIAAEAMAESLLLDWEGLTMGGEPLKYSREAAEKILLDPAYHDFRDFVAKLADDAEGFREAALEQSEKN